MLENMFGPSKITSNANQSNSNQSNSITQTPLTAPPTQQKQILHVKDQAIFDKLLKSHKCVIVDFTGQNCPPCRVISPIFEDLIIERMSPDRDIIGISVETSQGYLIAKKYQITATPTFIFFLDGKQFHSFRGANKQELVSWIDLLLYTAYPPHKHSNLKISFIETRQIILFSVSMNLDAVFIKANEYISRHDESKLELLNEIKTSLKLKYDVKSSKSLSCSNFNLLFKNIYDLNVDPTSFALLDILRLLIIDENIQGLIKSNNDNWIMKILLKVVKSSQHKAIMLMSLRLSCNLFFNGFNPISNELIENSMTCRSIIACLLIESLLNSDINIRNVAVSLAFNISIRVFEDRNNIDDEFTCEIIAAVFKALEDCNDDFEVVFKLMVSLGFLIYKASDDCIELVNALGGITVFQDKIEKSKGKVQHDKINKVVVDLKKLI